MRQVHFGNIDSWDDLGLFLPDDGYSNGIPEPKRLAVDVDGADGKLDLRYGLGGDTKFYNRTISLAFVMKDYEYQWDDIFSNLVTRLHGKEFRVLIDPETEYYWDAFCSVIVAKSDRNKGLVTIELDCDPYRHKDIELVTEALPDGETVTANVTRQVVVPEVTCENNIVIEFEDEQYSFDAGTHKNWGIRLTPGANTLLIKGTGAVTVKYRDGKL